ncbi:MAG TPA: HAD-IIB family hydrolase [Nitrospiria bacterium]|nr:HAD-IIB family hydrolase [Nitrospiria bacterium]
MPRPDPQPVLFTDLDGTLLDAETYSWQAAKPALNRLEERNVPWVLCSSKTRAEMEPLRRAMGHRHPFIVENGGAILIPEGCFTVPFSADPHAEGGRTVEIGIPYRLLRIALQEIARETRTVVKGFGDMNAEEVASQTGLPLNEAERARAREYDEPFIIEGTPEQRQAVLSRIESKGFRWTKGGRFPHLTGNNDKGRAVAILSEIYRRQYGAILTVGLGDSLNDLPMLAGVDRPVLVRRPDGSYEDAIALPGLVRADGIGPAGWNKAVLKILNNSPKSV